MLDMFKGQISISDLKTLSYKEAIFIRDARIDKLLKEKEAIDKGDKEAKARAQSRAFEEMVMNGGM